MALLDAKAKQADVALLCEMGLDPGIGLILFFFFFFFFFFSTLEQIRFCLLLQQINWLPLLRQIPY
jgi:saccharopine dehydrogenase-like NADP-dependent oxidoreductase